jgi:hypothetical protein
VAVTTNNYGDAGDQTLMFYDIAGADADPFDGFVTATGNQLPGDAGANLTTLSITPHNTNGLIIGSVGVANNTMKSLVGTGMLFDSNYYTGESVNGPSNIDQENGWGHFHNSSTSAVTFTFTELDGGTNANQWAANAIAFRASGAALSYGASWNRPRTIHASASAATITTHALPVKSGDLVVACGHVGSATGPAGTPFTDSLSGSWAQVTTLNPFTDSTNNYKISVAYSTVASTNATYTVTYHPASSANIAMEVLILAPPSTGGTLNQHGSGVTSNASASFVAASLTPAVNDALFACMAINNSVDDPTSVGGSWQLGASWPFGGSSLGSSSEFQLSAVSAASTTDNFSMDTTATSGQVIVSFTPPPAARRKRVTVTHE